jgi:hypothetical protein
MGKDGKSREDLNDPLYSSVIAFLCSLASPPFFLELIRKMVGRESFGEGCALPKPLPESSDKL